MRTEDRDPVQQADQTGPAQADELGGHRVKVAKFLGRMQGKVGAQSLDLSSISRSLDARLAALANPRGTSGSGAAEAPAAHPEGAPSPADPTAIAKELEELATAIDAGKSKIGMGTKFLTRLKTIFSSHTTYGAEIARLAFKQIDTEKQKGLLTWAFEAASADLDDLRSCVKFCQAAKVPANTIANAVTSIPDPARRVAAWRQIADSNLSWDSLDPALAKTLVRDLASAGPDGAGCLVWLLADNKLDTMTAFEGAEAKQVILDLASAGEEGASCLMELWADNDKLATMTPFEDVDAKTLVWDLASAGEEGASCLMELWDNDKLATMTPFVGEEARAIIQTLASAGEEGADCLARLLANNKLDNLPPFEGADAKAITQNLASAGFNGAYCLRWLRSRNILPKP